jgi:hypothetical protein
MQNTGQPRIKAVDKKNLTQWAEEAKQKKQAGKGGALDMDIDALFKQVREPKILFTWILVISVPVYVQTNVVSSLCLYV